MNKLKVGDKVLFKNIVQRYERAILVAFFKKDVAMPFFGYSAKRKVGIVQPDGKDEYIEVDLDNIVKYDWSK